MNTTTETTGSATRTWRVSCGGEVHEGVPGDRALDLAGELAARHPGHAPSVAQEGAEEAQAAAHAPATPPTPAPTEPAPKANSTFGGALVVDESARARIEARQAALRAGAVAVDPGNQLYATGTRMADVGYATQQRRADEHAAKLPVREAAALLSERVRAEKRRDVLVDASDVATRVEVDPRGRIVFDGLLLTEQAIRGLCSRTESPSLRYLLGVRDRVAREAARGRQEADREAMRADREQLAQTLRYELRRAGTAKCKLRVRDGVGDVFAALSPDFGNADAPELVDGILDKLPADALGTYSYDPVSTDWELRAVVQTTTPVQEQAVGEPFEGFASFGARDNGTRRLSGGGGVLILACLNAGVFVAPGRESSRIHRKNVLADVDTLIASAVSSIQVFVDSLGRAREDVVEVPAAEGSPTGSMSLEEAIPGFWRWLLRDNRSELAGVLPGKSRDHVKVLSAAYADQRRDTGRVVRSDLAQAWTRAIQEFPTPVRRDAERAVGTWLRSAAPVGCDLLDEA
jgi:hypothetical protein